MSIQVDLGQRSSKCVISCTKFMWNQNIFLATWQHRTHTHTHTHLELIMEQQMAYKTANSAPG